MPGVIDLLSPQGWSTPVFLMNPAIEIELKSDARGVGALQLLHVGDPQPEGPTELIIDATKVERADAFTGCALAARIEVQRASHPRSTVTLRPPVEVAAWMRMHDLLGPLPARARVAPGSVSPSRDRSVLFPAQQLLSMDQAHLLGKVAIVAARDAGMSLAEGRLVALATAVLTDNGLRYAAESPCGVMVSTAVDNNPRQLKVVAIDLGTAISGASDPVAELRSCIERSRTRFGGLSTLGQVAQVSGTRASVLLSAGNARAHWRDHWRGVEERPFAPGLCAAMIVHGEE